MLPDSSRVRVVLLTRLFFYVVMPDPFVDFFTVHRHVLGGIDTKPDLVALDAEYGDLDVVADVKSLTDTPG
jgi:hypothetical protein